MRINISKGGRKIELTKRERQTLREAKALLAELANVGGDAAKPAGDAEEAMTEVLDVLNGAVPVAPPY
jgi:hypothetical protein